MFLDLGDARQNRSEQDLYDVIIIGGGLAGATAAIYSARAELKTVVVDKGLTAGALGMTGKIANYPGLLDTLTGAELVTRIRQQAEGFGARFVQDRVLMTDLEGEIKRVQCSDETYLGRSLIVASGSMGRTRTVPGEDRLVGRGVSYCATCDGPFFQDQIVAVVGNSDEAAEEALFLTRFASRVHLLVHTAELRATPDLVDEIGQHAKVVVHLGTRLREVTGDGRVESVLVRSPSGEEQLIPVGGVFVYLQGGEPVTDFLNGQVAISDSGCIEVDAMMQTNIPGVFAVGDVLCKHLKQAVIAASEGAMAAMAVQRYLSGRDRLRPDWS